MTSEQPLVLSVENRKEERTGKPLPPQTVQTCHLWPKKNAVADEVLKDMVLQNTETKINIYYKCKKIKIKICFYASYAYNSTSC